MCTGHELSSLMACRRYVVVNGELAVDVPLDYIYTLICLE
jgi:hypothetical protein